MFRDRGGNRLVKLFAASEKEVADGRTTDIYFEHTMKVLEAKGLLGMDTVSEFTVGGLPDAWDWGVFCGSEEVVRLLEGKDIDLWGIPEGTVFRARTQRGIRTPVMRVEGPYGEYCPLETPSLGLICYSSGVATMSARCKISSGFRTVMSFGVRRMHPSLAPVIDRSSFIGGCDSVSSIIGGETIMKDPTGTMPHSLVVMIGDQRRAFRAFDEIIDGKVKRVALVDTFFDEKAEAIMACETVKDLYAVRLDTPGSRRGDLAEIIREVRWEMDLRGFRNVKIFVSGGLSDSNLKELADAGADGFGVGTSISNAPTIDFAMDIVERDGEPISKRGKYSGRKRTYRCEKCLEFDVTVGKGKTPVCTRCGSKMRPIEVLLLDKGRRVVPEEPASKIRERVLAQLRKVSELEG